MASAIGRSAKHSVGPVSESGKMMRMRTDVVLGIDVGSSGVRIAAVDEAGSLCALASVPMPPPCPDQDGRVRQHPDQWWRATRSAFARLDLTGVRVRALAVDGTSGTIVPIDAAGTPTGPASMYLDIASADAAARIAAVAPRETAALGRTSPLARALDLTGGRVVHQADWISARFSGCHHVTDENNALKTGYDPVTRTWPDWIRATGMAMARLPRVVPAGTRLAPVQAALADTLGLPPDVVVVAGTTDGCAAFLASGATDPGDGVTALGTTLTLKLLTDRPVFASECGVYSHRIGDQWLAGGASNSGGGVVAKYFTRDEIDALMPTIDDAAPSGLDYYPLDGPGERFPVNDPLLQARLEPRPDDRAQFLHGLLEGIAAIEMRGYQALAERGASPLATIRSTGGGAANAGWTRIRLRLLGVPGLPSRSEHAAVGTARLAWRGLGHAC